MLKTTRSSIALSFRVHDDEVAGSGGGAGAESDESIGGSDASRKCWTESELNCTEYPEDEEEVHLSRKPQRAGLIAEKTLINVFVKYTNFAFSSDLASELPEHTGINNHLIKMTFQVVHWCSKIVHLQKKL